MLQRLNGGGGGAFFLGHPVVQSADMHVSAFYASSVPVTSGDQAWYTHPHLWRRFTYTRELALTKRTRYNTAKPTYVNMRKAS